MRINVRYLPSTAKNIQYCQSIGVLVDEIFDGNSMNKKVKYIISTNENFTNTNNKTLYHISQILHKDNKTLKRDLTTNEDEELLGNDFLKERTPMGPMELGLINCLFSSYKVIVVTGALGSGKTELINYVCKILKEQKLHHNCKHYNNCHVRCDEQIIIDFNSFSIVGNSEYEIKRQFYAAIFHKLFQKCANLMFNHRQILDGFIKQTQQYETEYYTTLVAEMKTRHPNWYTYSEIDKLNSILIWIRERFENRNEEYGTYALLELCKYYYKSLPRHDQTCLLLIYDNIDGLDDFAQNIIVEQINGISTRIPFKSILTSRLMTFNYMKGNSSFSFKVYQNMGPRPIEIIIKRIEYYLNNKDDSSYKQIRGNIDPSFLREFDSRLEYIYKLLNNQDSRPTKTISALAGLSIRRGLRLVRRFFLTNTILWKETEPKEDILIRCLYSYHNESGMMNIDDNRISNIFVNKNNGQVSLVNLRILKIVNEMKSRNITIRIKELKDHLSLFNNVSEKCIIDNIKYLTETRKRLVFLLDYNSLDCNFHDLADTQVITTIAGTEYLNFLSSDLQYIQSCFESIEWKFASNQDIEKALTFINRMRNNSQYINLLESFIKNNSQELIIPTYIDYSNILDRLSFIRQTLKILVCKDIIESVNYMYDINNFKEEIAKIISIDNLITIPIVKNIAGAIFNIISRNTDDSIRNELIEWHELIQVVYEWNHTLFPKNSYEAEMITLIEKYKKTILT